MAHRHPTNDDAVVFVGTAPNGTQVYRVPDDTPAPRGIVRTLVFVTDGVPRTAWPMFTPAHTWWDVMMAMANAVTGDAMTVGPDTIVTGTGIDPDTWNDVTDVAMAAHDLGMAGVTPWDDPDDNPTAFTPDMVTDMARDLIERMR